MKIVNNITLYIKTINMNMFKNRSGNLGSVFVTFFAIIVMMITVGTGVGIQLGVINPTLLSDNDNSIFESIPNDSNVVTRVDVNGLLSDNTTNKIANESSDEFINNSTNLTKQLIVKPVENLNNSTSNVSIEPNDIGEVVVFSKFNVKSQLLGSSYKGAVVEIEDTTHNETAYLFYGKDNNYTKSEYKNVTKINIDGEYKSIAEVSSNLYIVGDESAVNNSIDTIVGDKDSINESNIPNLEGDTYINMYAHNMTTVTDTIKAGTLAGNAIPNNVSASYTTDDEDNIYINLKMESDNESSISNVSDQIDIGSDINGVSEETINLTQGNMNVTYETTPEEFEDTIGSISSLYGTNISGPYEGLKEFENNIEENTP